MKEVSFTCRVLTPLFMSGADGKSPELRPTEFKGMMRFWWRAAKGEKDWRVLRQIEGRSFGASWEITPEIKSLKSPFSLRISFDGNLEKERYYPLPHKRNFLRWAIKPGFNFQITLSSHEMDKLEFAKVMLLLSVFLGGFGKRSRRGFGAIMVEGEKMDIGRAFELLKRVSSDFTFEKGKIKRKIKREENSHHSEYPWIKRIEVGTPVKNWEELLRKIGQATHNHRGPSLGMAKPRFASPVYVSVYKDKKGYYPVITLLTTAAPKKAIINEKEQEKFVKKILGG